jgi:predicted nucleic acid-binding protein
VGLVVFDADVLIAHLSTNDAQHHAGVERVRRALDGRDRRLLSMVNYSEVLVGPALALGSDGTTRVKAALRALGIEAISVDAPLAERAAEIRARTKLKLPDAYAVATALSASQTDSDVRLESFDKHVVRAFASLRGAG